jgi:hypothetical protein
MKGRSGVALTQYSSSSSSKQTADHSKHGLPSSFCGLANDMTLRTQHTPPYVPPTLSTAAARCFVCSLRGSATAVRSIKCATGPSTRRHAEPSSRLWQPTVSSDDVLKGMGLCLRQGAQIFRWVCFDASVVASCVSCMAMWPTAAQAEVWPPRW